LFDLAKDATVTAQEVLSVELWGELAASSMGFFAARGNGLVERLQPGGARRLLVPSIFALVLAAELASPLVSPSIPAPPDPGAPEERAALILALHQYVEWPGAGRPASEPLRIGVLADEPLVQALARSARSGSAKGRAVEVRGFRNLDEVELCPILVVGRAKERHLRTILDHLRYLDPDLAILTVGENESFLDDGGMLRLVARDDRIAFEVNLRAAGAAGIRISSEMLRLADRVVPETPGEPAR
jgi:hypothetical protein